MLRFYLLSPLLSLAQNWQIKLPLTVGLAIFWQVVEQAMMAYGVLLAVNYVLLYMAGSVFLLDLASGIITAVRDGGVEAFSAIELKKSGFKFVEWAMIIGASIIVANGAQEEGIIVFDRLHIGAIFWLTITDFWSMLENFKGAEGALRWLKNVKAVAGGGFSTDQLTDHPDADS